MHHDHGGDRHDARALWFPSVGSCELRDEALPALSDGDVLVQTLYSAVSRGTESLVFAGKVPESETVRMRGPNMGGDFCFPVKYGYAAVGQVIGGLDELQGKNVFCLHPHQTRFVVDRSMLTVLPQELPVERAVLCANMETALNIVWDAQVSPGDRVAVFGAGVVGSLVAFVANGIIGTEVILIDRDESRRSLAPALGLRFATADRLNGEFDVLINASGAGEALAEALAHAGQEARIVEASWHGDRSVTLPLGGAFHAKRLSLISSQVGSIPSSRRARWDFGRRLRKALDLLADDRLDALISGETEFANLEEDYPQILANPATLCHRIRY